MVGEKLKLLKVTLRDSITIWYYFCESLLGVSPLLLVSVATTRTHTLDTASLVVELQ